MIRTNVVKLTVIPAMAFRQKLPSGDIGILIVKPGVSQPGMATISKKTGEPVPAANTPAKGYPKEAFEEAIRLTAGMPYRKLGNIKVTAEFLEEPAEDQSEAVKEEVVVDSEDYRKITEHFTDDSGKLSYSLINKEFIQFAKRSTIVQTMIQDGDKEDDIVNYIVANKFRNITGNDDLSDEQVQKIVELLDEVSPQSVFKELKSEIRKDLRDAKNK